MFDVEAARLHALLAAHGPPPLLLDLGSSTRSYREREQPHVDRLLFAPLEAAGVRIVHFDRAPGDGVDLVGDVLDPATVGRLAARGFGAILVSNLLEHVRDPAAVAAACEEIVGPGGLILASTPASYPYHADPVDTRFRPSPAALAALFARSAPLAAEELTVRSYGEEIAARGSGPWREAGATLLWALAAPLRPRSALSRLDRWRWYGRPYRVSIALVRRCAA